MRVPLALAIPTGDCDSISTPTPTLSLSPGRGGNSSLPRRGFTLIEAAITTVIIGVGTVAMLGLLATGTGANQQAAMLTTAVELANDIHELSDQLPYPSAAGGWNNIPNGDSVAGNLLSAGDVTWLDGQRFNPPVNATNAAISGMSGWSQAVTVGNVDPNNVLSAPSASSPYYDAASPAKNPADPMSRVTVTISYNGNQMFQTSWLITK